MKEQEKEITKRNKRGKKMKQKNRRRAKNRKQREKQENCFDKKANKYKDKKKLINFIKKEKTKILSLKASQKI